MDTNKQQPGRPVELTRRQPQAHVQIERASLQVVTQADIDRRAAK